MLRLEQGPHGRLQRQALCNIAGQLCAYHMPSVCGTLLTGAIPTQVFIPKSTQEKIAICSSE